MLAVLLLARRDEPFDLALRLIRRFQVLQVLFRTIPVAGTEELNWRRIASGRCPDCCSMSSTIGFSCCLSLASPAPNSLGPYSLPNLALSLIGRDVTQHATSKFAREVW